MKTTLRTLACYSIFACGIAGQAATITVTSAADDVKVGNALVTLREAIIAANDDSATDLGDTGAGDDTIDITAITSITLTSDLPAITSNIQVTGNVAVHTEISGSDLYRPFFVTNEATFRLSSVLVSHGRATGQAGAQCFTSGGGGGSPGMGGGLLVDSGNAILTDCDFLENTAVGGTGGGGHNGESSVGGGGGGGYTPGQVGAPFSGTHAPGGGNGGDGGPFGGTGGAGGEGGANAPMGSGQSGDDAQPGETGGDGAGGGGGGLGGNGEMMASNGAGGNGGTGGFAGGGGGAGTTTVAPGTTGGAGGFGAGGGGGASVPGHLTSIGGSGGIFGGDGATATPGGSGSAGGGGAGLGGAIFVRSGAYLLFDTVTLTSNTVTGGAGGDSVFGNDGASGQGKGGAVFVMDGATAEGTFVPATNTAANAGSDVFVYGVPVDNNDLHGTISTYSNDCPIANNDAATTLHGTAIDINVLANDNDPDALDTVTPVIESQPTSGSATVNPDNTVLYTPDANFVGTDSFTYYVTDGTCNSSTATVTVQSFCSYFVPEPTTDCTLLPDLTVETITAPVAKVKRKSVTIKGKVRIVNNGGADATQFTVVALLSDDTCPTEDDVVIKLKSFKKLYVTKGSNFKFSGKLPAGTVVDGKHVLVLVDSTEVVQECDENNNSAQSTLPTL